MDRLVERSGLAERSARPSAMVMPGYAGFWTFIAADATLFALLFIQFSVDRSSAAARFDAEQHALPVLAGVLNTVVLVTSSWTLATGMRGMHRGQIRAARRLVSVTILLGVVFAAIKVGQYGLDVHHGHTISSGPFFMYYFLITGIHLLHLTIGAIALVAVALVMGPATAVAADRRPWESVAAYWHLIDLLWMFIFPLFYLAR
jgi:nitric oxide reductase NorE protein